MHNVSIKATAGKTTKAFLIFLLYRQIVTDIKVIQNNNPILHSAPYKGNSSGNLKNISLIFITRFPRSKGCQYRPNSFGYIPSASPTSYDMSGNQ